MLFELWLIKSWATDTTPPPLAAPTLVMTSIFFTKILTDSKWYWVFVFVLGFFYTYHLPFIYPNSQNLGQRDLGNQKFRNLMFYNYVAYIIVSKIFEFVNKIKI